MHKKRNHDFGGSIDASFQEDGSSLQLSLPESIDDSLTLDSIPVIPSKGSSAEARLYFAQLQESMRRIERLEQEQNNCLDAIQNGRTPTDDEFESICKKHLHELTFQELFWKIVYDAVLRHRQQLDIQQQINLSSSTQSPSTRINDGTNTAKNQGVEQFDAQTKIQELQSTLLAIKANYLRAEKVDSVSSESDGEWQKLKRLNEELRHNCEKHQRSLIECKSDSLELERKIKVLDTENSSLLKEKEQCILKLDRIEEDCRKKDDELHETKTKLEHVAKYSAMKPHQTTTIDEDPSRILTHLPEKEDLLRPLERKMNQLQCELHERNINHAKLEILYEERGKQLKDYHSQVDMLQEQMNVLKREFANLEKESLMEQKRLNDEILRRDEQLDMYLESKMSYSELPMKEEAATPFQSPSKMKTLQGHCDCNHCRHLLAHTVVLGKKCKELQVHLHELETRNIQQQATAATNATTMRYQSTIHNLEERVSDLQKKNDAMRLEYECLHNGERRSIPKRTSSKSHAIHHIFIFPQQKKDCTTGEHDAKSNHLEYRGPGSFRVKS